MQNISYSKYGKLYKGITAIELMRADLAGGCKIYKVIGDKKEYYDGNLKNLNNYMNPYIFEETNKRFRVKLSIDVTAKTPLSAVNKVLGTYIKDDYLDYVEVENVQDLETKVYYGA